MKLGENNQDKIYEENQTVTLMQDANLKYVPSFTSRTQTTLKKGESFTVKASLNNWVKVSNDTNSGWILKTAIDGEAGTTQTPENTETNATPIPDVNETPDTTPVETNPATDNQELKGTVNVESAVLRDAPNGDKIDSLPEGTEVTILGEEDGWYKIKTDDYESCYIAKRLIKEK